MRVAAGARERFERTWAPPRGVGGVLAPVNNKIVGVRFMATAFVFFLAGGVLAMLMRTQLAVPENDFLDPRLYNQLFTMHGSTMMFLFVIPFIEGLAVYFLPGMIGSRDMAYPRLTAFGYWIYLFGGLLFYSSFFVGAAPDAGWFSYTPLSGKEFSPGIAQDFWLIGLSLTELSGITAGAEFVVTALKLRSPGMSLTRMPIFAWSVLVVGFAMIFAFTTLFVATLLLELERAFGMPFFDPDGGGSPLLWQHLFWIFGHPEVYIMFIPATGIVSTIVPTFARRPLALYRLVILALLVTAFVSFGLWVHHMFTTGLPELAASFFTATSFVIALATGTQIFAWIATLWGTRPRLTVPMLYVLGFVVIFMLGGVTGVMVAAVPFDWQVHDSFFVVAHFHYVLVGGVVLPILGALHYWLPKITGRMLSESLGAATFWIIFVSFNVTFFPMHLSGLLGMPRRVYSYQEGAGLYGPNLVSTLGSYALGVGFVLFALNVVWSLRRGAVAGPDPWLAGTLEWAGPSPPPNYSPETPAIVYDREPLWYEDARHEPDQDRLERMSQALAAAPLDWRATHVTSTLGGEPRGVLHLPGPTYLPFLTALFVTIAALGLLLSSLWLGVAGVLLGVAAVALWLWPRAARRDEIWRSDRLLDPEGRTFWPGGSEVGSLGAALGTTVLATIQVVLLFSFLYLAGPGGPAEAVDWRLPAMATGAMVLGAAALLLSGWRRADGPGARLLPALGVAVLSGIAFLALSGYALLEAGFAPDRDAFAAAFHAANGFLLLLVALAVALLVAALFRHLRGTLLANGPAPLANAVFLWNATAGLAVLSFAVLHLLPLLREALS